MLWSEPGPAGLSAQCPATVTKMTATFPPIKPKRAVFIPRRHQKNSDSSLPQQITRVCRCVIANVKDPWGAVLWGRQCFILLDTMVKHLSESLRRVKRRAWSPHLSASLTACCWGTCFLCRSQPAEVRRHPDNAESGKLSNVTSWHFALIQGTIHVNTKSY